jgi:hypothetical protein
LPYKEWADGFQEDIHLAKIRFAEEFAAKMICEGVEEGVVSPEHVVQVLVGMFLFFETPNPQTLNPQNPKPSNPKPS